MKKTLIKKSTFNTIGLKISDNQDFNDSYLLQDESHYIKDVESAILNDIKNSIPQKYFPFISYAFHKNAKNPKPVFDLKPLFIKNKKIALFVNG